MNYAELLALTGTKAKTPAGKCRDRHLHTDYDALLREGFSKEEARTLIYGK